jgi:hypothetical protein
MKWGAIEKVLEKLTIVMARKWAMAKSSFWNKSGKNKVYKSLEHEISADISVLGFKKCSHLINLKFDPKISKFT